MKLDFTVPFFVMILLILKIGNFIDIPWWAVFTPFYVIAAWFIIILIVFILTHRDFL
jgi:hypothetical protein